MHQILLSRYFRQELKQRIWERGLSPGRPHGVLLGNITIIIIIIQHSHTHTSTHFYRYWGSNSHM